MYDIRTLGNNMVELTKKKKNLHRDSCIIFKDIIYSFLASETCGLIILKSYYTWENMHKLKQTHIKGKNRSFIFVLCFKIFIRDQMLITRDISLLMRKVYISSPVCQSSISKQK